MAENRKIISEKTDMTRGPLLGKIILFALPLAAGSILQQMFNAVDVAVVGRFASSEALAAVGANTAVVVLFLNLFTGISIGSNVVIARYIGQKNRDKVTDVVHTSALTALITGLILLVLSALFARPVLHLLSTPENIMGLAVLYLRIYALGMPAIMIYNFGAAILRSAGDTKRPLWCLIFSGVLNALLNLFFVIVCHMGVAGVAIATVAANVVSAGMVTWFLIREESLIHLDVRKMKIHRQELLSMLRIGIPAGIQGMVFSFANVCIQAAINSFGSDAVAGSAAATNFEFICYFAINGFNQAAMTFISQNYGAKRPDRCRKIFGICMVCAVISCMAMNLSFNLAAGYLARLFTEDPAVKAYIFTRMHCVLLVQFIAATYEVAGSALRGYGFSMTPALLTVFGTCFLRIVWIMTVHARFHSFPVLMAVYPFTWIVTGILVVTAYYRISGRLLRSMES